MVVVFVLFVRPFVDTQCVSKLFSDFLPRICRFFNLACVFTKSWVVDTYFADSDLAKILQLGIYNNDNSSRASPVKREQDGIIDVSSASINEDRQLRSSGEDKK